jgi:predicted RNase H-related nuclease YkuK (DUF458 family)
MEKKFKRLIDGRIIDLIPFVKAKLAEADNVKLYIGSDSQNIGNKTIYAIVVVFHFGNSGANVIYSKREVPKIHDRFTRLWGEVMDSIEVAQYLEENGIVKPTAIDLDFNPDPKFKSNTVLRAALGYVESLGYNTRCKPFAVAASCAADRLCK